MVLSIVPISTVSEQEFFLSKKKARCSKMTLLFQATWILPIILASTSSCLANPETRYEWKNIDYVWKSDCQKAAAIKAGTYDHTKIIAYDVQPLQDGRVLITTPRYNNNPASLSTVSEETGDGGPLLAPYPDWSWHNREDCSGITSVNKVFLDDCNRLWLVDSGKIGNEQVCPAKILAFDADTDELLEEVEIPNNLSHSPDDESLGHLQIAITETIGEFCKKTWVYISDIDGFGFLIWDGTDIWRIDDEMFHPTPEGELFSVEGENFTMRGGPESFLLTPPGYLSETYLLIKPLSALKTYAVRTENLHNSKSGLGITYYRGTLTAHSPEPAKAYSKKGGILFASFASLHQIGCWNLQYPLTQDTIGVIAEDSTTLQYPSGLKILASPKDETETLWMLSNRFQKFIMHNMNFDETNFRVLTADVSSLVKGTICEPQEDTITIADSIEDKGLLYFKTT